jgi:hypothetical protein
MDMTALRRTSSAVAALALTVALLIPVTVQAAPSLSIPVAGTTIGGGTFSGVFTLTSFAVKDGQVVALGTVSGILSNAGVVVGSALTTVAVPTQVLDSSSCDILHLDLGPLALDILGLKVDLSRVVLDITAQTGPGNLLGNLLCAVTGLLDPSGLARLLNQILAAL